MSMPLAHRLRRLRAKDIQGKLLNQLLLIGTEEASSAPSSSSSATSTLSELESLEITQIHGLIHLPLNSSPLERLDIERCPELKSIIAESPITLRRLQILGCHSLQNLAGKLWNFSGLEDLWISGCDEFELEDITGDDEGEKGGLFTRSRRLRSLTLKSMSKVETLPRGLGCLKNLHLHNLPNLKALSEITRLQKLTIQSCPQLTSLPSSSSSSLIQLQKLTIQSCPQLITSLPEFLRKLEISYFPELTSLPDSFGNLTQLIHLRIWACPKLTCLPHSFRNLTALQRLKIWGCPDLTRRCRRPHGEDWPLIQHVPCVRLY